MDSLKNTITSLYVTGIHVGTNEQYIHKIFTKLGRVYKIKYYQGTTTAHVHMKCWWNKTEHIKSFADKIETGVTVPVVYNLIYYWNIGLFNPNSKIGKTNKNIEIQELLDLKHYDPLSDYSAEFYVDEIGWTLKHLLVHFEQMDTIRIKPRRSERIAKRKRL